MPDTSTCKVPDCTGVVHYKARRMGLCQLHYGRYVVTRWDVRPGMEDWLASGGLSRGKYAKYSKRLQVQAARPAQTPAPPRPCDRCRVLRAIIAEVYLPVLREQAIARKAGKFAGWLDTTFSGGEAAERLVLAGVCEVHPQAENLVREVDHA